MPGGQAVRAGAELNPAFRSAGPIFRAAGIQGTVASVAGNTINITSTDSGGNTAQTAVCTEIMRVLVEQFTILETMLPTHFLAFREKLAPASGFRVRTIP